MPFRPIVAAIGVLACGSAALANEVQFHICAAAQNLGAAYARTKYFAGQFGPDQTAEVAANLANAAAEIAAAEAGVEQPFFTQPDRQRSIAELQAKLAAYAERAPRLSPAGRMTDIQGFYTHYRNALSYSYASNRSDAFRWNPTCDSRMLDANWHLGLAATYAAVRFERGTVDEIHARSDQSGANSSAFQAIRAGLRLALDGTGPTPLEYCFFNTEEAWSIVPMLPADEPWATYVDLLPRVLEVCRSAGPNHLPGRHVTVPHCAGLMLADAKRRLAEAGLAVQLAPGSPAPSAADTGRVEAQSVAAGTQVASGTPVRLTVHSPYVAPPVPPAVPSPVSTPVVAERPSRNCDLKGNYGTWFRVTLENGRYIGRDYHESNDLPHMRQRGFHVGYTLFDVSTEPEYFQDPNGRRLVGFRGRCGDGSWDRPLAWADCWVAVSWALVGDPKPLSIAVCVVRDGTLTWTANFNHSTYNYPNGCWDVAPSPTASPAPAFQVPTPVPTPVPPAGPPACPGPAVTVIYDLWNPPPYGGLGGVICRDGAGGMWVNIANNVYQVTGLHTGMPDPSTGCFADTGVVTPHHTYGGTLCPK